MPGFYARIQRGSNCPDFADYLTCPEGLTDLASVAPHRTKGRFRDYFGYPDQSRFKVQIKFLRPFFSAEFIKGADIPQWLVCRLRIEEHQGIVLFGSTQLEKMTVDPLRLEENGRNRCNFQQPC